MASISLNNISYRYPGTNVGVRGISLNVAEGKIAALVGPSGCGKSTLLRLIAGFIKPEKGNIALGGEIVAGERWIEPERRRVGLVFQQHALFPHLDVARNILFGASSADILPKLLADFHLEDKEKRFVHELSGGEQQRVALARALAAKPGILLMDEPFASIDNILRRKIRAECMEVLRRAGITTIIVTHDAQEAMELADDIFVLEGGALMQSGDARTLYKQPVNASVGGLFGEINHITDPQTILALAGEQRRELILRPEDIRFANEGLAGSITHTYFRGPYNLLHIDTGGIIIKVSSISHNHVVGDKVYLSVR